MAPRHILLLTDRDWTHPQGGGTGTNLYGQVSRWIAWGHRVTVVAGSHPGAAPVRAARAQPRAAPDGRARRPSSRAPPGLSCAALGRDADVVLEVVNGITFLTPLWLRTPRVTLVHHVHRDHYVAEMGRPGAVAALLAETLPLRALYRGVAVRDDLRRRPRRPARARDPGGADPRLPARRRAGAVRARRARCRAAPALPRPAEAVQADRAAARRARGRAVGAAWTSPARATTARRSRPRSRAAGSASASCCTAT